MLVIWQYTDNNSKNKNNTNKLNLPFKGVPYCFNDNDVNILNSGIEANTSQGTKNQTTYNIIGLGQSITKDYIINRYGNELQNIKGRPEKNILIPGGLIYNTGNGVINK